MEVIQVAKAMDQISLLLTATETDKGKVMILDLTTTDQDLISQKERLVLVLCQLDLTILDLALEMMRDQATWNKGTTQDPKEGDQKSTMKDPFQGENREVVQA